MEPKMKPNRIPRRSGTLALLVRAAAVIALIGTGAYPARAQQAGGTAGQLVPALQGIEVLATPYFWMPWTGVAVRPSNPQLPSASGTISFGDLLTHLTWVPAMGAFEFRNGPYGLAVDFIHAPVRVGISAKNILFGSGAGGMTINTETAMLLYRPFAAPDQYLDVGAGFRFWGLKGDISLSQGLLPAVSVSNGELWADPLIGVRYHRDLGNGYGLTTYGDVGGFGAHAHIDWQLIGTIDYAYKSWIDLHAGFRSLNFNYSAERAGLTVNMYGPIIAATFRF
jgi:hypothetical protein